MTDHIYWDEGALNLLDQRRLPFARKYVQCRKLADVEAAIKKMVVRGAPLIGIVAAYGVAIGMAEILSRKGRFGRADMDRICRRLKATRPTAVNLPWALKRMQGVFELYMDDPDALAFVTQEALAIHLDDVDNCQALGRYGSDLIDDGDTVLTHCNAGALATGGYGTALGVIRAAHESGKRVKVVATETRPYLQGARLTVLELHDLGIDVELVPDNHVGLLCSLKRVNKVVVGADRVVRNGDTANKIGTYMISLCAHEHGIPFYVAAPISTFDLDLGEGGDIQIEERDGREVKYLGGTPLTLTEVKARYYSFDVTPAKYVSAFITEKGVIGRPFRKNIHMLLRPHP